MLRTSVFRVVDFCTRKAWWVIVLAVVLAVVSTAYTMRYFAIKTDVTDLFPPDLPWTQRAFQYMAAFPQPDILVVVDAPTPELVEQVAPLHRGRAGARFPRARTRPGSNECDRADGPGPAARWCLSSAGAPDRAGADQ